MPAALLVADSGPLIALARLDLLELPHRYFDSVLVTASVWEEITRKPGKDEVARLAAANKAGLVKAVPDPESIPTTIMRAAIDLGERTAIVLGLELGASLLIDDRRARRVAMESKLPVIGTLGLLIRAREEGFLPKLRPLIERLQATGYFLRNDLVIQALSAVGE
ncbi:MAG: DUF3368 domain-containing protein [Burkholderiales bacterium]